MNNLANKNVYEPLNYQLSFYIRNLKIESRNQLLQIIRKNIFKQINGYKLFCLQKIDTHIINELQNTSLYSISFHFKVHALVFSVGSKKNKISKKMEYCIELSHLHNLCRINFIEG